MYLKNVLFLKTAFMNDYLKLQIILLLQTSRYFFGEPNLSNDKNN